MADFYLKSGSGAAEFVQSNAYSLGARIVPKRSDAGTNFALARRSVWECTTAGTSAAAEPTWPASVTNDSTTVTSGSAVFTARKPGFSSGSTIDWTFATIYLDYLNGATAAGDTIFCSSAHSESITGAIAGEMVGTDTNPCFLLSVQENGASRPTTLLAGAQFTATTDVQFGGPAAGNGSMVGYGLHARCGNGGSSAQFVKFGHSSSSSAHWSRWVDCIAEVLTTNNSLTSRVDLRPDGAGRGTIEMENLQVRFSAAAQRLIGNGSMVRIRGLSRYGSSGSTPTGNGNGVVRITGAQYMEIEDYDASGWGTDVALFDSGNRGRVRARGIKVPSGWTGKFTDDNFGLVEESYRVEGFEYVNPWGLFISHHKYGTIRDDTTVYITGGAEIEGQPLSWRFTTTSSVGFPLATLHTHEMFPLPVDAADVASPHTITMEVLCNLSAAPTNAEAWLTATYRDDTDDMLMGHASGERALLASAANLTTSTAAWTGTARANSTAYALNDARLVQGKVFFCTTAGTSAGSEPAGYATAADGDSVTDGSAVFRAGRRHVVTLTVTPQRAGFIRTRLHIARASATNAFYANPKLALTV